MQFSVLASGSTGNSLYVETEQVRILIDAGLSGKQITERLSLVGADPATLTAIFVSHEHIDHVKGVGVLARKYQIPIYMNEATWRNLPSSVGEIPPTLQHIFPVHSSIELKNIRIESFPISHDAAQPMNFWIANRDAKLAVVTDLGYVNQKIVDRVTDVDTLIWESNHDVEMLRMGAYPWSVKRRILSDVGHLSNEDAAVALTDILKGKGENVYLAHLSKDNNLRELAHMTVKNILEETGLRKNRDFHLHPTFDDKPTPLRKVRTS
ncbi:MBL fold metallo-hydrolase [Hazenella sp. IB182357]|uniref:MBL fold metallo-hydrolase n=1 Tax=Polycladospora coralii TaxID=2771432 RepID=A0A926N8D8_9BACL|nr:MBL fold metallo-hydrolase [Polycladospora coralii]MBD1372006.1 MBL fold metallo-hydrolase [Polycladospora coralii]